MANDQGYSSRRDYDKDVNRVPDFLKIFWSHPDYMSHLERADMQEKNKEEEYRKADFSKRRSKYQSKGKHPFDSIAWLFETYSKKPKRQQQRRR